MSDAPTRERGPATGQSDRADYESTPLTRAEYIAAIVHLYRGELYRANTWRLRLDNTTNWAVLTTAGMLSYAFGEEAHSHWILLVGSALVTVFWAFESRRFRFADLWAVRVRKIEENFYGPILRRDPVSPEQGWGELVAADLFYPRFKIGRLFALQHRLRHNYWALYVVLFFAWVVKVVVHPATARSWGEVRDHLTSGMMPWWLAIAYVIVIGLALAVLFLWRFAPPDRGGEGDFVSTTGT